MKPASESQHSRLHGELQLDKRRRLLQDTNFALDDRLKEVRPSWCWPKLRGGG